MFGIVCNLVIQLNPTEFGVILVQIGHMRSQGQFFKNYFLAFGELFLKSKASIISLYSGGNFLVISYIKFLVSMIMYLWP